MTDVNVDFHISDSFVMSLHSDQGYSRDLCDCKINREKTWEFPPVFKTEWGNGSAYTPSNCLDRS